MALASIPELLARKRVDGAHVRRPSGLSSPEPGPPEGVQGELEAIGFREIKVGLVNTYMPFEIARYLLTQFPGMSRMTSDMTREEFERVRDLMVEYTKSKHPLVYPT
ncbi:hypothetical protein V1523DRAFT_429514 [Lipomyces doorenjongii]